MRYSTLIRNDALVGAIFFALTMSARAGLIPVTSLPLPNRVADADTIVVGKVTSIEEKNELALPYPGAEKKVEYEIAVVTIRDSLMAAKGLTTIRVGFVSIPFGVMVSPAPFQPTIGMEGCFFLAKHGGTDFLVVSGQLGFIAAESATFDADVALIGRCSKLLVDPTASLRAKNEEDSFLTAGMLVARYSRRTSATDRAEPIEADRSWRILSALALADWTPTTDIMRLSPRLVLGRLPLTAADGWTPPPMADPKAYAAYSKKWVEAHTVSYRIRQFVPEKAK